MVRKAPAQENTTEEHVLLSVRDLVTVFPSGSRLAIAVNGVSFELRAGETLGLVGESGSGKSVCCRSILRIVPEPGIVASGSVRFQGRDVLALSRRELRELRGSQISMIFQDPMSSLNPVFTIGDQITEPLRQHRGMGRRKARQEAARLLERVGIRPRVSDCAPTPTNCLAECASGQ